jgi:hypothetical protein
MNPKYIINVPIIGTEERWYEKHAYSMRYEAIPMRYLRNHTSVSIPEMITLKTTSVILWEYNISP